MRGGGGVGGGLTRSVKGSTAVWRSNAEGHHRPNCAPIRPTRAGVQGSVRTLHSTIYYTILCF